MAKVSMIIPTYNAEKYIGQVLENILSQTFTDWELIVVDDGSTDKTESVVRSVSDPRIRFFSRDRDPKGSVTCRNIGQAIATGEYFIHFDADDFIAPFCLKQRVEFLDSHPDISFATFRGNTVFKQTDGSYIPTGKKWGVPVSDDDLESFLSADYPYSVWNNIYRSDSFKDYQWDEKVKIYTDFSYIVPVLICGKKHAYDKESKEDYEYRMGQSNAMTQSFVSNEKYESTKYLFTKTLDALQGVANEKKYRDAFYRFFRLQFQRLVTGGTSAQVKDFYRYTLESYPEKNHHSLRCAYFVTKPFQGKTGNVQRMMLKGLATAALQPSGFFRSVATWAKNRMK